MTEAATAHAQLLLAAAQDRLRAAEAEKARHDLRAAELHEAAAAAAAATARAEAAETALDTITASRSWRLARRLQRAAFWRARPPVPAPPQAAADPDAPPPEDAPPEAAPPEDEGVLAVAYAAFLDSGRLLDIPAPDAPDLSVVVAAAPDAPALLLACLHAVLAQSGCLFEVVLSDPGQGLGPLLERTQGLRFGTARAPATLLLDAALLLRPGALAAAASVLGGDVAAVAGRIVGPDGRVEQAGHVLWRGGGSGAYGAGLPDGDGAVMVRRDTDHAGSGLMLTTRTALEELGNLGSDAAFGAAVRAAGLRTVYVPGLVADRFGPPPPAPGDAALRHQALALRALAAGRLPPNPGNLLHGRDPAGRRRLLVLDGFMPLAVMGAGYPRARAILNEADAIGWAVTLFPMERGDAGWAATYESLAPTIEVCGNRGTDGLAAFLRERAGFFDVLLVSRPEYMRALRAVLGAAPGLLGSMRLVYDAEALFSSRAIQLRTLHGTPPDAAEADAMLAEELALTDGVDAVMAVTDAEAAVFARHQDTPAIVVSHPLSPRLDGPGFAERSGFLYVGRLLEQAAPNYDGLAWFVRTVWPGIRAALPGATLTVVGALHAEPAALVADGVVLAGPQPSLGPAYDAARVFVAPVRYAAGVPIKVLEAGEAGLPVAATALVAAQLGWHDGAELVATDDPAALAAGTVRLHEDAAEWARTREAASGRLAREHGHARFRGALARALG